MGTNVLIAVCGFLVFWEYPHCETKQAMLLICRISWAYAYPLERSSEFQVSVCMNELQSAGFVGEYNLIIALQMNTFTFHFGLLQFIIASQIEFNSG